MCDDGGANSHIEARVHGYALYDPRDERIEDIAQVTWIKKVAWIKKPWILWTVMKNGNDVMTK